MAQITEKDRILILAQARKRKAEAQVVVEQPTQEGPSGGMAFLNKGFAETLGAPVDLISAGLSKVGIEPPAGGAFGGSESFKRGFEAIGAPSPSREPEGVIENIGAVAGEVAGFALPLAKTAQAVSKGAGTAAAIGGAMNRQLVQRPIQSAAIEGGAVIGSGIARDIAKEQDLGPGASMLAELGGGLAGGFAGGAPVLSAGVRGAKRVLAPFSEAGSFERASLRAREIVDNPELAAKNIEDLKGSNLLPSAKSQDPGLMTLEKTVAAHDPALGTKMEKSTSDTIQGLIGKIRESGSVKGMKEFLVKKRDRLKASLDARVEIAGENARKAIDDLGDVATEADISIKQRESLDSALADARVQEAELWQAVPIDAKTTTSGAKAKFKKLQSELSQAQSEDMPAEARKLLGGSDEAIQIESGVIDLQGNPIMVDDILTNRKGFSRQETIREMDGLYKKLGETARQARLASNNNKARIAEDLRESILDDMGKVKGSREARESVATARAFSKEVNGKFSGGTIGKILGTKKGAAGVAPELTLATGVGPGGLKGSLAAREIATATGEDVTQLAAVQEFIKRKFLDAVIEDGVVNPTKARNFIASNPDLMETYPHLKAQFTTARTAEDASRSVKTSAEALRKRLDQPSVSATAKILNAPVDQEVATIFKSSNPSESMQLIVNAVRKDKSGKALKGLRAGVSEHMIDLMTSPTQFDVSNRPKILGSKLKSTLTNENSRAAMSRVFNKKEMANWDKIADQLVIAQRQMDKSGRPLDFIINDRSSWLLRTAARIAGARVGSKLAAGSGAGGSIQSAGIGSQAAQDIMNKLTADKAKQLLIDAVTRDDDLLIRLLQKRTTANDKKFDRVLRNYMVNAGRRLLDDEEDAPQ